MAGKEKVQAGSQVKEPLVRIVHTCDIHYAEDRPNGFGGTHLVMTSKTLSAEAIVPASKAIELAKDLAEEIWDESNSPCLSYDCENAKCKGWINALKSLAEEYKDLQDKEPDYDLELMSDNWGNDLIYWAFEYTKEHGLIDDYAHLARYALAEVNDEVLQELLDAGYTPEQIFDAFSKYIEDYEILYQMCYLKDQYPEVKKFLEEQEFECDEE